MNRRKLFSRRSAKSCLAARIGNYTKDSPETLLGRVKFVHRKTGKGFLTLKTTPARAAWNRLPYPLIDNTEIRRSKIDRCVKKKKASDSECSEGSRMGYEHLRSSRALKERSSECED